MTLPDATLKAEARRRVSLAMVHIERAQNELYSACQQLSAINGGIPVWKSCSSLGEKVHAFWYRVQNFRDGGRYTLDGTNAAALERELAAERKEG